MVDSSRAIRRVRSVISALTFSAVLLGTAPAFSEIYTWRDTNGRLVFSDRKLDPSATTHDVPSVVETAPSQASTRLWPTTERDRYDAIVREHATRLDLRPELIRAVIQAESGYNPRALSPKGAMGLMQLMPATAAYLGVRNPYDPADNIKGGMTYLRELLDRYDGNEELALAAYNAGAAAVDRHGRRIPPYRETKDYVRKISRSAVNKVVTTNAPKTVVYKISTTIGGRPMALYQTARPTSGDFTIVTR